MSANSGSGSQKPAGLSLKLIVRYTIPSLNSLHGRHWSVRWAERKKALNALLSALRDIESDCWIPTILPEDVKICSMAYDTLNSFLRTIQEASDLKPNRKKSEATRKKEQ
jgi:hypothetical protein